MNTDNDEIIHNGISYPSKAAFDAFKRAYPLKYKAPKYWGAMPEMYYERSADSDAVWIDEQLSRLSGVNRDTAADDYSYIYTKVDRHAANAWLMAFCGEFGISRDDIFEARERFADYDGECELDPDSTIAKILARIRENKPKARSKWGEIFQQIDTPKKPKAHDFGDLSGIDFDDEF